MGISFSSNRRRNNPPYYHHRPPPPPPPYYYSTDPVSLPAPPPPPPPQQSYYPAASTAGPSYPAHPPPPPPPPIQSYYNSQPYQSFNYANRFNYQPYYYASQANGWPQMRPNMGPGAGMMPIEPAPYTEHQNAKKIRNDVNVHKDTLKVEIDEQNPDNYLVSFVFDALFHGSITILYFAKEESQCRFVPQYPEAHMPLRIPFQKGLGQKFCQPSGTGIDLGFFELDDLSKPSAGEDVFPLVIVAETFSSADSDDSDVDDSVPNASNHMQITQAVLEKKDRDLFQVRVVKQILWIDGVRYELRELYGIGSSSAEGFDDCEPEKECVICMTEPKDTAVLPCRHMCMCSECAKELRLQSNKCPICRHPIEELIEIKINNVDR